MVLYTCTLHLCLQQPRPFQVSRLRQCDLLQPAEPRHAHEAATQGRDRGVRRVREEGPRPQETQGNFAQVSKNSAIDYLTNIILLLSGDLKFLTAPTARISSAPRRI